MQAAFVDVGLDRAAFLYVGDVRPDLDGSQKTLFVDEDDSDAQDDPVVADHRVPIQDLLREGQILMVQVAKDPLGTKGARITTHISLPGRHVVFLPTLQNLGISRRIESQVERDRLKAIVESLKPNGGVIVRTAGEGASQESLQADLEYLHRLWKDIEKTYDKRKNPSLVHSEMDVELRALRDLMSERVDRVIVDDAKSLKKIQGFVNQFLPKSKTRLELYSDTKPLFDLYDIELEISRSLDRKIWLKSGGYIVIDEAEALVVIDVNTGRFVGKKDLEDTIVKTNLEAVKEVAHQLRIRNCGGIVIIDFIDMETLSHREQVMTLFTQEMQKDLARTTITSMSELGLVEMTRKRIRPSLVSTLCEPCPYCDGKSYIRRKSTVANEIFTSLERESASTAGVDAIVVSCHQDLANWIYAEEAETLELVEQKLGRAVAFKTEPVFHVEEYKIHRK
jgi:ribonuclease G